MILVELVRLLIVLLFTGAGYRLGLSRPDLLSVQDPGAALFTAVLLGSAVGYVFGGIVGRLLLRLAGSVEDRFARVTGEELVAGTVGIIAGAAGSLVASWALLMTVPWDLLLLPLLGLIFVFLTYSGYKVTSRKRFQILSIMGLAPRHSFRTGDTEEALSRPRLLDTSAIIDGRIAEVAKSRFLGGHLIVLRVVLAELQSIADSSDSSRRARGRRGLEVLEIIQRESGIRLEVSDEDAAQASGVDARLVAVALRIGASLITTDWGLHKMAELQGVPVLNVNELALAVRPAALPGEEFGIRILKEGKEAGQGVGYLEDGTLVVVEGARRCIGDEVTVAVTSVLQTAVGKMIFARLAPGRPS